MHTPIPNADQASLDYAAADRYAVLCLHVKPTIELHPTMLAAESAGRTGDCSDQHLVLALQPHLELRHSNVLLLEAAVKEHTISDRAQINLLLTYMVAAYDTNTDMFVDITRIFDCLTDENDGGCNGCRPPRCGACTAPWDDLDKAVAASNTLSNEALVEAAAEAVKLVNEMI